MISLDTDEDKDDFNVAARKNLSNLFEDDISSPQSIEKSKSSLFYKPKQNKKPEPEITKVKTQVAPGKLSAFCASAVDVHKLDNGKYVYVSKLGIALLGNDLDVSYRLILYTGKNQPICMSTIHERYSFICQPNSYSSFYDDARQNWSILFQQLESQQQFCRNIAHCVFALAYKQYVIAEKLSSGHILEPVIQDVGSVQNPTIPSLTNHVIKYRVKSWVFDQNESLFENTDPRELVEEKVVPDKTITTESDPLLLKLFSNMSVGNVRYLVGAPDPKLLCLVIPDLSTNQKDLSKVWKIALEVELLDLIAKEEWDSSRKHKPKSRTQSLLKTTEIEIQSESQVEVPVPAARKSQSPSTTTDLATRMAKIGAHAIFPLATSTPEKVPTEKDQQQKPTIAHSKPTHKDETHESHESHESSHDQSIKNEDLPETHKSMTTANTQNPSHKTHKSSHESTIPTDKVYLDDKFNILRNDLLEVKSLLLSQKSHNQTQQQIPTNSNLTMDSAILLNSIQKIIEENSQLKTDLATKTKELEKMNQKFVEFAENSSKDEKKVLEKLEPEEGLKLRTEILDLKELVSGLKEEKYKLSMENLALEKKLLEGERDYTELSHRLSLSSKQFRASLKQTLTLVYQEFNQALESQEESEPVDSSQLLSQVLIRIKKQQQQNLVRLHHDSSPASGRSGSNSRRSSIGSESGSLVVPTVAQVVVVPEVTEHAQTIVENSTDVNDNNQNIPKNEDENNL